MIKGPFWGSLDSKPKDGLEDSGLHSGPLICAYPHMSYSLNSLKVFICGLYRDPIIGVIRGLPGVQTVAHVGVKWRLYKGYKGIMWGFQGYI